MLIASLFFASMAACLKYALVDIPLYQAVFFRCSISSFLIGLVIFRKRLPYMGQNRKALIMRSLFGFMGMSCGFYALAHIPFADAAVLHQTSPLFVAIFGFFFLKERVGLRLMAYIALALFGVILVMQPQWHVFNVPGLVAVLGGAFAGLAYVTLRHLHQSDSSWVIAFHFASIASLISLPLMVIDFVLPTPHQWLALIAAGVFGTGGQVFLTVSYRYEEAARLAPFSYAGVAMAVIYGIIFWGEVPNFYTFLGMILIVIAGMAIAQMNLNGRRPVALGED